MASGTRSVKRRKINHTKNTKKRMNSEALTPAKTMFKKQKQTECNISAIDQNRIKEKLKFSSNNVCDYIMEALKECPLLKQNKWRITKLLGIGTVGTVFGICESTSSNTKTNTNSKKCFAIKIQFVGTGEEEIIKRESLLQNIANNGDFPIAPDIISECFFDISRQSRQSRQSRRPKQSTNFQKQSCYAIIMEQLDKSSLDVWLGTKKDDSILEDVFRQIILILEQIYRLNLIHGDLIWFNLGYKKDEKNTESGIDIRLIDFDRAGIYDAKFAKSVPDAPQIDVMRLLLELIEPSPKQAKMNEYNKKFLLDNLLDYAKFKYPGPHSVFKNKNKNKFIKNCDKYWENLYERYCVAAGVKCLD